MSNKTIGFSSALGAFALWGLFPLYWKTLQSVPSPEIVAYRMAGSGLSVGLLLWWMGRLTFFGKSGSGFRIPSSCIVTAVLLAVNWGIFIWAINAGYVLQSSLAYYISPLASVVLGVFVLNEKLRPAQWAAVGLAAAGVAILTFRAGAFPLIAILLALTFALYALVRKRSSTGALDGHFLEMMVVLLPAIGYLVFGEAEGSGSFLAGSWELRFLLLLAGPVTALPLVLFAAGARRLPLSTVGLIQYITPTLHFVLAVFVFGEPFTSAHLTAFGFIWAALALYSGEGLLHTRNAPVEPAAAVLGKAA